MTRLDQALVERALCDSREKAKRLILAGVVRVNGHPAKKASDSVKPADEIVVDELMEGDTTVIEYRNWLSFHSLRHTAATLKLRQTRDLKTTSLILGHASTRTTERYVHLVGADVLRDVSSSALDELRRARKR